MTVAKNRFVKYLSYNLHQLIVKECLVMDKKRILELLDSAGFDAEICSKNDNSVIKHGIKLIRRDDCSKKGQVIVPVIYDEAFMNSENEEEAVKKILLSLSLFKDRTDDIRNSLESFSINKRNILDYAQLGLQRKTNEPELVTDEYLDLELYVYVDLSEGFNLEEGSPYSFKIYEHQLKSFNISKEELFDAAIKNTQKTICIKPFFDFLIASNESGFRGGVALFYTEILKKICEKYDFAGLYVIPSSIHDNILIPTDDENELDPFVLKTMINEVNHDASCLAETEILSDHPYYYDYELDKVIIK